MNNSPFANELHWRRILVGELSIPIGRMELYDGAKLAGDWDFSRVDGRD